MNPLSIKGCHASFFLFAFLNAGDAANARSFGPEAWDLHGSGLKRLLHIPRCRNFFICSALSHFYSALGSYKLLKQQSFSINRLKQLLPNEMAYTCSNFQYGILMKLDLRAIGVSFYLFSKRSLASLQQAFREQMRVTLLHRSITEEQRSVFWQKTVPEMIDTVASQKDLSQVKKKVRTTIEEKGLAPKTRSQKAIYEYLMHGQPIEPNHEYNKKHSY